jgi:nitroreductase
MDFLELVNLRHACRRYQLRRVEEAKLLRVLEAARLAPSGSNRQPWKFIVVVDFEVRRRLIHACANQQFVASAPVVIAGCGLMPDRVMSSGVPGDPVDLGIAMEHLALAATAEGLASCWIGAFSQDEVREVLGIPATVKVIGLMTIGYPAEGPRTKIRKPLAEIITVDHWA